MPYSQGREDRLQVLLDRLFLAVVAELVEDVVVGRGGQHAGLFDAALADLVQLLDVLGVGANPGRDLRVLVAALEEPFEHPEVALLVDERLDGVDAARPIVEAVEEVDVAEPGLVGEEGNARVLGAVAERGVGNELGFGVGCGKWGGLGFELDGGHPTLEVVVDAIGVNLALRYHVPRLNAVAESTNFIVRGNARKRK